MGKQKQLLADTRQAEELLKKDGTKPTNTALTSLPKGAEQRKMKGLTLELANALEVYLKSKPYEEVAGILNSLSQSPVLDVTLIPNGNG